MTGLLQFAASMSRPAPEDPLWWTDVRPGPPPPRPVRTPKLARTPKSARVKPAQARETKPLARPVAPPPATRMPRPRPMTSAERMRRFRERHSGPEKSHPVAKPVPAVVFRDCAICGKPFTVGKLRTTCGSGECQHELARAKGRRRSNAKRAAVSDITVAQEAAMRRKARDCPLCGVRMTSTPGQPASKELDHILPIAMGGPTPSGTPGSSAAAVIRSAPRTVATTRASSRYGRRDRFPSAVRTGARTVTGRRAARNCTRGCRKTSSRLRAGKSSAVIAAPRTSAATAGGGLSGSAAAARCSLRQAARSCALPALTAPPGVPPICTQPATFPGMR